MSYHRFGGPSRALWNGPDFQSQSQLTGFPSSIVKGLTCASVFIQSHSVQRNQDDSSTGYGEVHTDDALLSSSHMKNVRGGGLSGCFGIKWNKGEGYNILTNLEKQPTLQTQNLGAKLINRQTSDVKLMNPGLRKRRMADEITAAAIPTIATVADFNSPAGPKVFG